MLWTAEGTNTGEGNGLPATGKKVKGRGITIWRIVNGKIKEEWSEFDELRLMKQLGLIPSESKANCSEIAWLDMDFVGREANLARFDGYFEGVDHGLIELRTSEGLDAA